MSISIKAKYKKGLFARKIAIDQFMKFVGDINVEGEYDAELLKFGDQDFEMRICPNGILHFHVTETLLEAWAVTSIAGPGFHKAVIDILELLEHKMVVHFDIQDPTDYQNTKGFGQLQKEHTKDLRELLTSILKERTPESLHTDYLAWSNPWYPTQAYEIVTPFGSYTKHMIESYLQGSSFLEFAQSYFVWFDEGKTPLYHKQIALYQLWNQYKWRKPVTQEEANLIRSIIRHLEVARMVDPAITLPHAVWQDICANNGIPYLNLNEEADMNQPNIGYLRHEVHYLLPMNYGLKASGTYALSNDDGSLLLRDIGRTIRIQIVPEAVPGQVMDPRNMLEAVDFQEEIDGYAYVGQFKEQESDHGTLHILQAFIQGSTSYANVMIMYQNPEDKVWAMDTLKKIETPSSIPFSLYNLS